MIFGYYLVALGYWLVGWLLPERNASATPVAERRDASVAALFCLGIALAASFVAQLAIIGKVALAQNFLANLPPLPLVGLNTYVPDWAGEVLLLLVGIQCALLALLYRALHGRTLGAGAAAALGATCLGLLAAALSTRTTTSFDLYLYVGLAHLGSAAYTPPHAPFSGEFGTINRIWGIPLFPSAYGPLWVLFSTAVVKLASTLGAQLELFRIAGAIAFAVCVCLLFALRFEPAIIALFALNPAVVEQFVANGHNDLVPVALTLGALLAARNGRVALAVLLAGAAGATKLPFAAFAALAFTDLGDVRRRVLAAVAAACLALAATVLGSHGAYFTDAALIARATFRHPHDFITKASYFAGVATTLIAIAFALLRKRFNPLASWAFATVSHGVLYPWYVAWCVPYALLEASFLPQFLIALPVAAFFLTDMYSHVPFVRAAYALVALAPLAILIAQRRGVALHGAGFERKS